MSDPRLTYDGQSAEAVNVSYSDLPADTRAVFVDEFDNDTDSGASLSGEGSADIPTTGVNPGEYYLSARSDGQELARTVDFYVAGAPDNL